MLEDFFNSPELTFNSLFCQIFVENLRFHKGPFKKVLRKMIPVDSDLSDVQNKFL